eukprot:gnl/TRDRNA2_/TRDRNA2_193323_c0_seq1.p1 gnl/TRDRNA2_/TRDRNA2_193323_c0~~gnl/TRDRNA2_/TRDRNA2_193323_c0_seq1.p1  ORF type:complete len:127 (-),score=20.36 gnl/TRDRNA2_/TRDRNA2_193323_c0_seq1:52-432(-)
MRLLSHQLVTSFSEEGGDQGDGEGGHCANIRPAVVPRIKCPGVGPEIVTRHMEGSSVCAPQPPACCEAARRAEAAVENMQLLLNKNPLFRMFKMASLPVELAALQKPPQYRIARSSRREEAVRLFL